MYVHKAMPESFELAHRIRAGAGLGSSADNNNLLIQCAIYGCIKIFWSITGEPIGYIAYGKVCSKTLKLCSRLSIPPAYSYELSGGKVPLLLDAVALPKWRLIARSDIFEFLKKFRCFSYLKRGKLKVKLRANGRFREFIIS